MNNSKAQGKENIAKIVMHREFVALLSASEEDKNNFI
jgi:hypothetical protein